MDLTEWSNGRSSYLPFFRKKKAIAVLLKLWTFLDAHQSTPPVCTRRENRRVQIQQSPPGRATRRGCSLVSNLQRIPAVEADPGQCVVRRARDILSSALSGASRLYVCMHTYVCTSQPTFLSCAFCTHRRTSTLDAIVTNTWLMSSPRPWRK